MKMTHKHDVYFSPHSTEAHSLVMQIADYCNKRGIWYKISESTLGIGIVYGGNVGYVIDADCKTENSSEIPNNCEWSVEYAKEMLDTMLCEECGHWEHGAGDHYYCALLEMRQECCFESKGESTLMFANKPKDESTISKMEQVDTDINVRSKDEPKTERSE